MDTTAVVGVIETVAANFGISVATVLEVGAVSVLIVNWLKERAELGGWRTYAAVVGVNVVLSVLVVWPAIGAGIAGGLMAAVLAILGWGTLRQFRRDETS